MPLKTSIILLATTSLKLIYEGTVQRPKTPLTVKVDYSLPFVFDLSVLVFIHHLTLMPQQLVSCKTLFERGGGVSVLESQAVLTGSAFFPCSATLSKELPPIPEAPHPSKERLTCVTVTVISIQMGYSFASSK